MLGPLRLSELTRQPQPLTLVPMILNRLHVAHQINKLPLVTMTATVTVRGM